MTRERETPEFAAMVRRMIRAHGRRVVHGDEPDLAELVALREVVEEAIATAVAGQREVYGRSWSEIGRGLGTTRQSAHERYGQRLSTGADSRGVTDQLAG